MYQPNNTTRAYIYHCAQSYAHTQALHAVAGIKTFMQSITFTFGKVQNVQHSPASTDSLI